MAKILKLMFGVCVFVSVKKKRERKKREGEQQKKDSALKKSEF